MRESAAASMSFFSCSSLLFLPARPVARSMSYVRWRARYRILCLHWAVSKHDHPWHWTSLALNILRAAIMCMLIPLPPFFNFSSLFSIWAKSARASSKLMTSAIALRQCVQCGGKLNCRIKIAQVPPANEGPRLMRECVEGMRGLASG